MGLFDRLKRTAKPVRKDPAERWKQAGAREYEAKRHDRAAENLDAKGDSAGAQAERDTAAELREPAARRRRKA